MLDMYRQPDKLLRACELILERRIAHAMPADPNHRDYPQRIEDMQAMLKSIKDHGRY